MQKTIMNIVLTGLLVSVVTGCDKQSEISEAGKKFIAHMEDSKNFTDNAQCYIKVAEKQQEKAGKTVPTLHILSTGLERPDNIISKNQVYSLMKDAIDRGCDVNEDFNNINLLMMPVTLNDVDTFAFLVENGADPSLQIESTNPRIDGKNIFEYSALLNTQNNDSERIKTDEFVQSYKAQFEK